MNCECQEYEGVIGKHGYGQVRLSGKSVYAHRLAWALNNGADPTGKVVMHTCDNRKCVNPEHLRLGTQAENVADMDQKDRRRTVAYAGEGNGNSKLTASQVAEIRSLMGVETQVSLAKRFGVSQAHVSKIQAGVAWS